MEQTEQKMLFEDEPTSSTASGEPKAPEQTETEAKPIIKAEEILAARPAEFGIVAVSDHGIVLTPCAACGEEIWASEDIVYSGKHFHKTCVSFNSGSSSLKDNPRLELTFSARASELAHLLEVIEIDSSLKNIHDHLADTLIEHDNAYIRCAFCGKVVTRAGSTEPAHTKEVKKETGAIVAIPKGRFYSRVRGVEFFCSPACDLNYSKQLRIAWEKEQADKASKKGSSKKADTLTAIFKLAKSNPAVAAQLNNILAALGATGAKPPEEPEEPTAQEVKS